MRDSRGNRRDYPFIGQSSLLTIGLHEVLPVALVTMSPL